MPTNDERLYYIRLSKTAFQTLTVKQAFLDARPLIKDEGDPNAEPPVSPTFYTEADALTFEQALRLYKPESVALMKEVPGEAPTNLGTLADHDPLPSDMTNAFFALNSPKLTPLEIAALVRQADQVGQPVDQVLVPYGEAKEAYLKQGVI